MNILLTGTRSPVTRDLARAFAACGHSVHGIDSVDGAVARPLLDSFTTCAAPVQRFDLFAEDARAIVDRLAPDLIIPLCEDIFHWRHAAAPDWPLFAPDMSVLMQLHSKFAFVALAQSLGLPAPETQRFDGPVARPEAYVFKPEFSRFGVSVRIQPQKAPRNAPSGNPWLRQDWIDGEDLSAHAIARDGQLTGFAAYRSAWRAKGGASYHFDPVEPEIALAIEAMMAAVATHLNLTGQFASDLRRGADGRLWLIECNPRATSGLHLLAHDPEGLSAAFTGNGATVLRASKPCCLGPAMWLYGLSQAIATGRLSHWHNDLKNSRNVLDGRGWAAAADTLAFSTRAILHSQSLQAAMTADIACDRDLTCN
jgi:hypothetical protein